jgi:hypothetical protein
MKEALLNQKDNTRFGQPPISIYGPISGSAFQNAPYWPAKMTSDQQQPAPEETEQEETDESPDLDDLSEKGRDVAGYLRITCQMGQAKMIEPFSLTAMYVMYGVDPDEWDALNKLAEAYKQDAPKGKFEDIMMNNLVKAFTSR